MTINSPHSVRQHLTLSPASERISLPTNDGEMNVTSSDHCPIQYQSVTLLVIIHRSCYNKRYAPRCATAVLFRDDKIEGMYDGRLLFARWSLVIDRGPLGTDDEWDRGATRSPFVKRVMGVSVCKTKG